MTEYVVSWFNSNDGEDEDDEMTLRVDVFCESEDADKAKSGALYREYEFTNGCITEFETMQ